PVVSDDEVAPEAEEASQEIHSFTGTDPTDGPTASLVVRRRVVSLIRPSGASSITTRITRIAASPPGQRTPDPSAAQNVPKVVSITPTPNFIVFSGTRLSGARTMSPPAPTMSTAAPAPIAASGIA